MNLLQKFWDRHVVLLMLTALFWAGNAVAGRIAIDDVSPFLLSFLRWFILLIFVDTLLEGHKGSLAAAARSLALPHFDGRGRTRRL